MSRNLVLCLLPLCSAACVKTVTVVPVDDDHRVIRTATVTADGRDLGAGVTEVEVRGDSARVSVLAGPEWLPATARLDKNSPPTVEVMLTPDELYLATTEDQNQVVNRWINISIAEHRRSTWWSTVVAAISGADFEIEIMDASSGFLRTAWRQQTYRGQLARRRFTGNLVTQRPLVWRIRYEVERQDEGSPDWMDYDRGFADELRVLQEIRGRTEH